MTKIVPAVSRPAGLPVRAEVLRLAIPAVGEMLLFMFAQIADLIMVGRLGPAAIAAVAVSTQPVFLILGVFQALGVGTTVIVARCTGAGQRLRAEQTAGQSLVVALVLGAVFAVLGLLAASWCVRFMGAADDVVGLAVPYFRLSAAGVPLAAVFIVMSASVRGAGDAGTPMRVALVSNLVNIIANYVLIFGHLGFPALGVTGAGIATLISRLLSAGLITRKMFTGVTPLQLDRRDLLPLRPELMIHTLRIGLPAALEQIAMRGGQLVFVRLVAGLGTLTLAAHQIALNIESLAFMPAFGLGLAASTVVGQSLGACDPDRARAGASEARRLGIITMAAVGLLLGIGGPWIMRLYTTDPTVIELGARVLRIMAVVQPAVAINLVTAGGLRGAGDTKYVLLSTAIGIWGGRVGFGHVLAGGLGLGLVGAWIAMALDQCVRATLLTARFARGRWQEIDV